jgi:hypothetical protein
MIGRVAGLALSARELTVHLDGRTRVVPLAPFEADTARWPALEEALAALAREEPGVRRVAIALLPPLAVVRPLELPALRPADLRRLLARNTARYFPQAATRQVVGIVGTTPRGPDRGRSVVAAAAPAGQLEAIRRAATSASLRVSTIAPAAAAWAAACRRACPGCRRGRVTLVADHGEGVEVLALVGGAVTGVRRFRAGRRDAALVLGVVSEAAAAGGEPARAMLLTDEAERGWWEGSVIGAGGSLLMPDGGALSAAAMAARGAALAPPTLLPDDLRAELERRSRSRAVTGLAAAAVLLLAAGAIEWWGTSRALMLVREQRAAIQPALRRVDEVRGGVQAVQEQLLALVPQSGARPWVPVLAEVAVRLPRDARLQSLILAGDTLRLEGLATRAAGVFEALRDVALLDAVEPAAPIRRVGAAGESFALTARRAERGEGPP